MIRRLFYYTIFIILISVSLDYFGKPNPKYEVGDCVVDKIHDDKRKVTNVGRYIYNYCKIRNNKCSDGYSMRIKDFDRIMNKTSCEGEKDEQKDSSVRGLEGVRKDDSVQHTERKL